MHCALSLSLPNLATPQSELFSDLSSASDKFTRMQVLLNNEFSPPTVYNLQVCLQYPTSSQCCFFHQPVFYLDLFEYRNRELLKLSRQRGLAVSTQSFLEMAATGKMI